MQKKPYIKKHHRSIERNSQEKEQSCVEHNYKTIREMVWVTAGGDKETINRLTDIFILINIPQIAACCLRTLRVYGLVIIRRS